MPTPLEEPPRRRLVFHLRQPGCTSFGIGVIPNTNTSTAAPTGNAGFDPQAGPSNVGDRHAITSFTAANAASGFVKATAVAHPSFTIGMMAAHRGAPPFYDASGPSTAAPAEASVMASPAPASPPSAAGTSSTNAPSPPRPFGHVAATDHRPSIRRGTWSPATLGLSSEN
ncbi:hypothetical protein C2845_PM14G12740 [Panicum miliaceum]|uniref:Uncharacterized protein n=1 Tax=Panicum miliaceum TaxID=4540 RepID=A0A3L6PQR3_PANMI|nr:hypothetical protein C2845_PM14G12740 [Panicum miliaceum]